MKLLRFFGKLLLVLALALLALAAGVWAFLTWAPSVGRSPDKAELAARAAKAGLPYDGRFHNENERPVMTGEPRLHSDRRVPKTLLPAVHDGAPSRGGAGELRVTWMGHSSTLVQLGERNIFIDPMLSDRSSPLSFIGPKRFAELPFSAAEVPELDAVFLSHEHYDHLDYRTILAIDGRVRHYIVPLGLDAVLRGWGVSEEKLHPLAWWESVELDGVRYTLTPAQHFSNRNPLRAGRTLWGGLWFTDGAHSVYATGDGGYCSAFSQVYERLGAPDLMLADIGQYDPSWAPMHTNPSEAVHAALDAHARWVLPVHWGAFCICNHAWDEPIIEAVAKAEKAGVLLATPRLGQTADYDAFDDYREHWWEGID